MVQGLKVSLVGEVVMRSVRTGFVQVAVPVYDVPCGVEVVVRMGDKPAECSDSSYEYFAFRVEVAAM